VVDGVTKEVGRVIPGVLQKLPVTQELISRASRVAANCDAEIIR
jgi:pyruvate-ferredoxin/flavodoxin oxidoreductase